MSSNPTGVGGFKEVIALIEGKGVYSRLKYESGVHRVQRVPATEASGRIHTSAITVAVFPKPKKSKSRSTKRICGSIRSALPVPAANRSTRHIPRFASPTSPPDWSFPARMKNRRSRISAKGLRVLRSRLYEMEMEKQQKALADERRSQVGTGDRSEKIRTYNYPQNRVTDHRIGLTLHRLDYIMDGDIDEILEALHLSLQAERLKKELVA